jgi:FkbH-like protein
MGTSPTTLQQAAADPAHLQTIVIASNFTIEPIQDALQFWLDRLAILAQVIFAPYNQVFQQLLDPAGLFAHNQHGLNVIVLRLQDWMNTGTASEENAVLLPANLHEFTHTLLSTAQHSTVPILVLFTPFVDSQTLPLSISMNSLKLIEETCAAELAKGSGLYVVTSQTLVETYPVSDYADSHSDAISHIPYTSEFFTALASMIARRLYVIQNKPYKVIVLDCDNTLWKGVCAEDGPRGVEISFPYQNLHEFMLAQRKAGVLLCLCSKNSEADVLEVLDNRPEMHLRRQHIVSWRINWLPKSENLKSLASELDLGLDSFILVDDNPLECAEVQSACPQVLTVLLPKQPENIPAFLKHIWVFDHLKITQEDVQRTVFYQQNAERERSRQQMSSFDDFLANLNLQIDLSDMQPQHLSRVSQLTRRTNQFNATTLRRSESEIQALLKLDEFHCMTVQVSDRFGEYGLVGVVIYALSTDALKVDTFLLSCRALGRGVEHRMLSRLGEFAQERQIPLLEIPYIPTERNQPFLGFIESVRVQINTGAEMHSTTTLGTMYSFPASDAARLTFQPQSAEELHTVSGPSSTVASDYNPIPGAEKPVGLLEDIADNLSNPAILLRLIQARKQHSRSDLHISNQYSPPRTPTESKLVALWAKTLDLDLVGVTDNFFDLGGGSLLATRLLSNVYQVFGLEVPLQSIFDAPTPASFARYIDTLLWTRSPVDHQTSDNQNIETGEL